MDKGRAEVGKVLLGLRGQPGAGNFLLLVQKKVTKEKDPPGEPPLAWSPCVTRRAGRLWNSLSK